MKLADAMKRIEELERRLTELENRPLIMTHTHYHYPQQYAGFGQSHPYPWPWYTNLAAMGQNSVEVNQ